MQHTSIRERDVGNEMNGSENALDGKIRNGRIDVRDKTEPHLDLVPGMKDGA
jgi:hypothetical protein